MGPAPAWPEAELRIVPDAGHSAFEPGIVDELVAPRTGIAPSPEMGRARLRDLGIALGHWPPGPLNGLTDVPGVRVGHTTVIQDGPRVARTGVTVVVPGTGPAMPSRASSPSTATGR